MILLLSIAILCSAISLRQSFTSSQTQVTFYTAKETAQFLSNDSDNYVKNMTTADIHARKVKSTEEYIHHIIQTAVDFTHKEKQLLEMIATKIDNEYKEFSSTPWKFMKTKGTIYEDGMPHTRNDIIFLPESIFLRDDIQNTILHEKIHIYQRANPEKMKKDLFEQGYKIYKKRSEELLARANPDLDEWIYIDPITKKPMVALYTSTTPSSLSDVHLTNLAFEHPYEAIAYTVANAWNS